MMFINTDFVNQMFLFLALVAIEFSRIGCQAPRCLQPAIVEIVKTMILIWQQAFSQFAISYWELFNILLSRFENKMCMII